MPRPRRLSLPAAAAIVALSSLPAVAAPSSTTPTRVLLQTIAPTGARSLQATTALAAVPGVAHVAPGRRTGVSVVELAAGAHADHVAERLEDLPGVAWAEPDRLVRASELGAWVDDPLADQLWGVANAGQAIGSWGSGTAGIDAGVTDAWEQTRGDDDVVVAVIDTGVDVTHPDLASNIWRNPGEIAGNGVDDDGNGYVDDVNGWDFLGDDASVYDDADIDRHGTHVAGTIAAVADNDRGVVGVAPGVTLLPLKFMGEGGTGWTSDAVAALEYAADVGADVVNLSWGGPDHSQGLSNAIASIDAVVVAAAGNASLDIDEDPVYPAALPHDQLVTVAAIDFDGNLPSFSNTGEQRVDLAAPGVIILSTMPGGAYGWSSGTSMASPHVAGVAALAMSAAPSTTPADLVEALRSTARPLPALAGRTVSGGVVDAGALLADLAAPLPAVAPEPDPEPTATTTPQDEEPTDLEPTDPEPSPTPDPDPAPAPTPPRLAPVPLQTTRLAGTDRYATGVAISREVFDGPVRDVYVATGQSFPDALAATSAAASRRAPVLLVGSDHVPGTVRAELDRLSPRRIWILGGTAAVSDRVAAQLRRTGASVRRLSGADRSATSAVVSAHAFDRGVPVAYLATGQSFPDALGAGAAAGRLGGPVLLTATEDLAPSVAHELARLRPDRVVVLGGTGAISARTARAAGAAARARVVRLGGQTRYDTAARVVADAFPAGVPAVLVATGESFPDALAGGAAAGLLEAPVLLVPPSGDLPDATRAALRRLSPDRVVVLGGVGALPGEVLDRVTTVVR